ncbi:MAG: MFS transporter [Gammaproteobacteria bacterium]|nr:MFS transporter [Gammaproteobacteria bacterium]
MDDAGGEFSGRRHTLMFLAIVPTGIFVWLLFTAPPGLGQVGLFAWMLSFCLAARIAGSFYSVPAAAVAAELTENATVRAELGIWRQVVAAVLVLAAVIGAFGTLRPLQAFERARVAIRPRAFSVKSSPRSLRAWSSAASSRRRCTSAASPR